MKFLAKSDLSSWIGALLREGPVVAPTKVDDMVLYKPIEKAEQVFLGAIHPNLSCKDWFFPLTEAIFDIERKDGEVRLVPAEVEKESVIFGVPPCDARALALLDKPLMDEPADALYAERRAKTALVGMGCIEAGSECFCESMGTGPRDSSNLDVLLLPVEGGYLVEGVTEKGKALLSKANLTESDLTPPPAPSLTPVPADGIAEVARKIFDDEYWERLADRCIHCNICAYVCPVCYCFDIRDYHNKDKVERIRTWESCQSPGFTKIAGGYTPRPSKGARMRQRFCHKLLYFPERYGLLKCTGCGRCVTACPV
ncbi:MAG: 4Fe-4S dicluster domain-containing protein, partial [Chloroflexota bacterium]